MTDDLSLRLRIDAATTLTPSIRAFRLTAADDGRLPAYTPGAHLKFQVTLADGTRDLRSYSLVGPGGEPDTYEIAVQRERDGFGSAFMHGRQVGEVLAASAPRNDFPLIEDAEDTLLIAGGIGITPILAMAERLAQLGRPFTLHYAARSAEAMAYRERAERTSGLGCRIYLDGGDPSRGCDLKAVLADPRPGRHVYVCGPKGMIDATLATAEDQGWRKEQVHFELFTAAAPVAGDGGFEVVYKPTGLSMTVPPDKTILEVMIASGLDPLYDCKRGECGVCAHTLIEGEAEHRDYALATSERKVDGGKICVCISRAKTPRLVIAD